MFRVVGIKGRRLEGDVRLLGDTLGFKGVV